MGFSMQHFAIRIVQEFNVDVSSCNCTAGEAKADHDSCLSSFCEKLCPRELKSWHCCAILHTLEARLDRELDFEVGLSSLQARIARSGGTGTSCIRSNHGSDAHDKADNQDNYSLHDRSPHASAQYAEP
jgi:hypothetical protein